MYDLFIFACQQVNNDVLNSVTVYQRRTVLLSSYNNVYAMYVQKQQIHPEMKLNKIRNVDAIGNWATIFWPIQNGQKCPSCNERNNS